jgi:DnaJ-class molecular chaperone
MNSDLYAALGLKHGASDDDIRQAYRKLAKQHHPDRNPGDKSAEEKFKKISSAFAILGNPDKRKRYDAGEIDAAGHDRPGGYYQDAGGARGRGAHDYADFGDIFSEIFGRSRDARGQFQMRGMDFRYTLEIDFLEAVNGVKKRVKLPEGDELDVGVPAGMDTGGVLRLKGKGEPGVGGGPAGDALIELRVRPHPFFERQGDDISLELPVTIDEAVLGGKVEVPTIEGRVTLSIPKGASGGQTLRLRGKGVKNSQTRMVGDQLVKLKLVLPAKIDAELAAFMEEWRQAHAYDPRAKLKETL